MGATERNELERLLFADVMSTLPAEKVKVIDESSTHCDMNPLYAWAAKGERAYAKGKRNYGSNVSLIASLSLNGCGPAFAIEGPVNSAVFATYVNDLLVPTLQPGDIVLMDNLSSHKTTAVRQAIEARGAQLLFFPAYSPDFSPIEQAFSKIKAILRRIRPPTLSDLYEALQVAIDQVTNTDALGYFCAAGFLNIR